MSLCCIHENQGQAAQILPEKDITLYEALFQLIWKHTLDKEAKNHSQRSARDYALIIGNKETLRKYFS
jgi:hypothetical protein